MNVFILLLQFNCVFGANILYIAPFACYSHHKWNKALTFGLINKGHNVTMLTHNEEKTKPKNFHLILLEGLYEKQYDGYTINGVSEPVFKSIKVFYDFSKFVCEHDFTTKGLATLMNYPKDFKFDLIIFDVSLVTCLYPLIDRFNNPPVVGVTPFLLPPTASYAFGNPLQTSYKPFYNALFTDRMSFVDRLANFIFIVTDVFYRKYVSFPEELTMAKAYFGNNTRSLEDIERSISILLSNTDPNLEYPLELPPNIIPVGGLQIEPPKPLPQDLQYIVDTADNGIVVFSLGSHLQSNQMSLAKKRTILTAFSKIPQTVIWKYESHNLRNVPKNVIISNWLPQNDLLAQPKVKLLINHGGGLSSQEAMYHGVPLVTIPFFGDQFANAARLKSKNMAEIVDYKTLTTDSFYQTITKVLNNPMYRNNIQTLSKRYRDRLNTPLETAVFWVEYVLRHGSAEHLNLAARDMSYFQTSNLDVYAFLLLVIYLVYSLLSLILTCFKVILRFNFKGVNTVS